MNKSQLTQAAAVLVIALMVVTVTATVAISDASAQPRSRFDPSPYPNFGSFLAHRIVQIIVFIWSMFFHR